MRAASDRRLNVIALGISGVVALAAIAVIVFMTSSGPRSCRSTTNSESPFACDSVWNARLPNDSPIASTSPAYTAALAAQVAHYGPWINSYSYSVPLYKVGPSQPRVPVALDISGSGAQTLAADFHAGVPIPADAVAAPGSDQHMVVWQPSSDTLWELWHAEKVNGVWHARWGGEMHNVSSNPGYYRNRDYWGASATGLSILGGLIGPAELRSGRIDHALALAIPHAAAGRFVFPAQRTDGNDHGADAIPEGTRFRLNPRVNVAALHLPHFTEMVALAAQRYGMIVRDQSGAVSLYVQQPSLGQPNPYYGPGGLFGGLGSSQLLRAFPWRDLEVVRPPSTTG
jgi:hypothetical protein